MKWILGGGKQSSAVKRKMRKRVRHYVAGLQAYIDQYPVGHWVERYKQLIKKGRREGRNG